MINIDFNNINDEIVYEAFHVEGNEAKALNDSYLELFELFGRDAMPELFTHFHGDKIDCPMWLYRPEFIADLAKNETVRSQQGKERTAQGGASSENRNPQPTAYCMQTRINTGFAKF